MTTKRRAAITATFAAVFLSGLLLTAFGGTPSPPYVSERMVLLGESGSIIEGHVDDIVTVQLGDKVAPEVEWRFASTQSIVLVTAVRAASMPVTSPPDDGTDFRHTTEEPDATYTSTTAEAAAGDTQGALGGVQMVRLTMLAPGVATVKGWRTQAGPTSSSTLPDFVFVVLIED